MNRFLRLLLLSVVLVAVNGPFASMALAQAGGAGAGNPAGGAGEGNPSGLNGSGLTNPLDGIDSLPEFLEKILGAVVDLGVIILTLAIVYVGFLFVKAQGNEEQLRSARSALMWTVIGGLVLLGAQTIGMVIRSTVDSLG
jgi:hypothetical protein